MTKNYWEYYRLNFLGLSLVSRVYFVCNGKEESKQNVRCNKGLLRTPLIPKFLIYEFICRRKINGTFSSYLVSFKVYPLKKRRITLDTCPSSPLCLTFC